MYYIGKSIDRNIGLQGFGKSFLLCGFPLYAKYISIKFHRLFETFCGGSLFSKEYIKTGIFDVSMSDIISEAFDIRSDSDYNDYFVISKKEVEEQISNAQYFYDRVEEYVVAQIKYAGWNC